MDRFVPTFFQSSGTVAVATVVVQALETLATKSIVFLVKNEQPSAEWVKVTSAYLVSPLNRSAIFLKLATWTETLEGLKFKLNSFVRESDLASFGIA